MENKIYQNSSLFIKDYRSFKRLTQTEFAEMVQFSVQNVAKWEQGKSIPPIEILLSLTSEMGYSINDVLNNYPSIKDNVVKTPYHNKPDYSITNNNPYFKVNEESDTSVLTSGQVINASTHAELINKVFGKNYKAWMKCVYFHTDKEFTWFVRFDGKIRSGWKNEILPDGRIKEYNVENVKTWDGKEHTNEVFPDRLIFSIQENPYGRRYIFLGKYRYDNENSNVYTIRYYDRISTSVVVKRR